MKTIKIVQEDEINYNFNFQEGYNKQLACPFKNCLKRHNNIYFYGNFHYYLNYINQNKIYNQPNYYREVIMYKPDIIFIGPKIKSDEIK